MPGDAVGLDDPGVDVGEPAGAPPGAPALDFMRIALGAAQRGLRVRAERLGRLAVGGEYGDAGLERDAQLDALFDAFGPAARASTREFLKNSALIYAGSSARYFNRMLGRLDPALAELDGMWGDLARDRTALPVLPRKDVPLGAGTFEYAITDEEGRLNVNSAQPDRLDRLLREHGIDKNDRDTIIASIQDWRDGNDSYRLNGAESDDYYLKLPVPYRARNANLESTSELLQIRGITPAVFHGAEGRPGLADVVTVRTVGQVNINTAGLLVLRALGFSDAEATTTVVCSIAPYSSRMRTACATCARFWPMAT